MGEVIKTVGDLGGMCGHDGTDWEKVLIDASKRLVVAVASMVASDVHEHQYDGSEWRKSNLLWGYNDRHNQAIQHNYTSIGWKTFNSVAVPAGEVHVINGIVVYNTTGTMTTLYIYFVGDAGAVVFSYTAAPTALVPVLVTGSFPFKATDYIMVGVNVTAQPCNVVLGLWGSEMKVNM